MKILTMLFLLFSSSMCFSTITDPLNDATDGILSEGEYGGHVKVENGSVLTVNGGGASDIDLFDTSSLTVLSTSEPYIDFQSGISWIVPSDNSTLMVSGGITNYIYVKKDATVFIDGGNINLIRSIQKPSLGKTITIDCQYDSWDWIYNGEDVVGIYGKWHNGDDFSIGFLNDTTAYVFPDTWTHVEVIPEPTSMLMLGLGSLLLKRRVKQLPLGIYL